MNNELKYSANKLSIGNRIECMKKREALISVEGNKENFENNPKCRFISKITQKAILEKLVN